MATAKELGLKPGDIVRIARQVEEPFDLRIDGGVSRGIKVAGLDMQHGPLAEVLKGEYFNSTSVRYLESEGYTSAGTEIDIHGAYVGFTRLASREQRLRCFLYDKLANLREAYRKRHSIWPIGIDEFLA